MLVAKLLTPGNTVISLPSPSNELSKPPLASKRPGRSCRSRCHRLCRSRRRHDLRIGLVWPRVWHSRRYRRETRSAYHRRRSLLSNSARGRVPCQGDEVVAPAAGDAQPANHHPAVGLHTAMADATSASVPIALLVNSPGNRLPGVPKLPHVRIPDSHRSEPEPNRSCHSRTVAVARTTIWPS